MATQTQPQQDYGQAAIQLLGQLINPNNTPLAAISRALGGASATQVGQNPIPNAIQGMASTPQPQSSGAAPAPSNGPSSIGYHQKAMQAAIANRAKQLTPAADEALTHIGPEAGMQQAQLLDQQEATKVQTQTQQPQGQSNALGILGNLLHNFSQGAGQSMMNSAGVGQFQNQQAQAGLMRQQTQNINPNGGIQAVGQAESQKPLTQGEKATVQAGINTASIQSMNDQMARLQAQRDQLTKEFTAEIATLPPLRNPLSQKMTPRMVEIRKQLADLNTTQNSLHNQFMTWKPTNVNQSSQSQDDNKGNSFTVGRFQVSKG